MKQLSRRGFMQSAAFTAAALAARRSGAAPSGQPGDWSSDWAAQAVIDTRRSPFAKLHGVPVRAVTIHDGFWKSRREVNVETSLPTMHALLEEHGRMDNFRRLMGTSSAKQIGPYYSDSDVYKWAEAASWAQQSNPELFRANIDAIIHLLQGVQESDGYLNTYFQDDRKPQRMTDHAQIVGHELYNLGHLLQAAVAQYRATGDKRMLDCCIEFVDGFLIPGFGPEASKRPIVSGHPEIEMSLIELYRITGEPRYLKLAGYILEGDSRIPLTSDDIVYLYSGAPFTGRKRLEGHAVRAMYACCGATDYYLETGDAKYLATLTTLWDDLVRAQMYVTGGVGARRKHEAFGDDYELPNLTAYGESCAAIGNMMWNWRMLHATADARHADVIERALYNGINSGMSLSGTTYCYRNPLAYDPTASGPIRNPWYDTTCCPPNLERTLASLPGYFYSTGPDGLYVHLFHNSTLVWKLESGVPIKVEQATDYPWEGRVRMLVTPKEAAQFALHVRVPGWAKSARVTVNGTEVSGVNPGKYLELSRLWKPGDAVEMDLGMQPQMLVADRRVAEDQGKVAVQRGPIVYCAESIDQAGKSAPRELRVSADTNFSVQHDKDLLGGITVLEQAGQHISEQTAPDALYAAINSSSIGAANVRLIPYYAWANREPAEMAVWLDTAPTKS